MQLHIILNAYAGSGRGLKRWRSWQPALNIPYILHTTDYRGHGFKIAQEIAQQTKNSNDRLVLLLSEEMGQFTRS